MEPLKITFTTFLKVCASTPRGMIRELRTFTTPGGYDFYKVMKRLAAGIASGAIDLSQAEEDIAQIVQKPEREHTLEAIKRFHSWFIKQDLKWQAPPRRMYKSDSALLTIRLEPELAFTGEGGITSVVYLWNLNKPELKKDLAGEGLQLLMNKLVGAHYEFGIFDLRKNRILGAETVSPASEVQLQNDVKIIEQVWKDIHNPSLSIDETIEHITTLKLPSALPSPAP